MNKFGTVARLVAVLTVLLALSGRQSGVFAQDPDESPAAEEAPPASYYVGVSCWPVGDGSLSACSFTGSASDGAAIEALWVPAWVACAEVVDSGGASWTGDGYHVMSNSLTLTLVGSVSPGGGAGYFVRVNGTSVEAAGDGLYCSPAPVVQEPEDTTGDEPVETTDPGEGDTTDEGTTDEGAPVAPNPDEATPETDSEGEGNATTGEGTTGEAPVAEEAGDGGAPEVTGDGSSGDGSVASAPVAAAQDESGGEDVQAAAVVDITVLVYNCEEDPGAQNPADVCTEDPTVPLTATDEGTDVPIADCGGVRCFAATVGNTFVVTETVPDDHEPIGDASETIDPVEGAATIVFVNVDEDAQGDPQLGRVQIVLGQCPSTEDKETKYTIIEPDSFQTRAAEESCGPIPGAFLTISGGDVDGSIQGVTDEDGEWRGFLPPGDDYVVSGSFGSSPAFGVIADDVTAVVIIDYTVGANGSLIVTRTVCTVGDEPGTEITVSTDEPDTGGEGCGPANGQFTLEEESGDSIDFSLGNDGIATMNLPVGTYILTDHSSNRDAEVTIVENVSTYASVRTISLVGRLVVRHFFCSDPASHEEDPTDGTYWRNECDEPQTTELTLADGSGDPIDTRSGKVFTWSELDAGAYSVAGGDGFCATLNGYTDASAGFVVEPNSTARVYVYTCADPGNGNGGDDDDDGDDDGGNNGGDDDDDDGDDDNGNSDDDGDDDDNGNTDDDEEDEEEVAGVTTLPETGAYASSTDTGGLDELALLALALPALLAGAALSRRRAN